MNRSRVTAPALAVLTALAVLPSGMLGGGPAFASPATVADSPEPWESIQVSGTGEVFGEPDKLSANFAVETNAATVAEALDRATAAATRMRDALVKAGVARIDLQTSNVDINATRDDDQKLTGYAVNQGLTATIRNLPGAGALLTTAIKAGGDAARLSGVSFAIEDDSALLTEARKKAFAAARGKAELYAREAGRPLGRVLKISEATPGHWAPVEQNMMADMKAYGAAAPIEPGRQRLSVTVTVEWALDSRP